MADLLLGDEIGRTATQVRLDTRRRRQPTRVVHRIAAAKYDRQSGHFYMTACLQVMAAADGAIRTTHEVSCQPCIRGGAPLKPGPDAGGPVVSKRSHGRPTPSRGARVERRKAERPAAPPPGQGTQMQIPDSIRALGEEPDTNEEGAP